MAILLVYIPAYKNHLELAINQARKLRNQWESNDNLKSLHKIEIYLSINGLDEDLNLQEGLFDYFYHSRINIGWDANMNKGFIEALNIRPDYFWLLSCDDSVANTAIETIFQSFMINNKSKLIIAKNNANFEIESIDKIFDVNSDYSLGLISSVIYNFQYCELAFPSSYYYGWSGWGQLSVLLKILEIYEAIDVISVDPKYLYSRVKYEDKNILLTNITKYQHSYYGNLMLRLVNSKSMFSSKKIVVLWVIKNSLLHNLYASAIWPPRNEHDVPESINWRKGSVVSIIKGVSFSTWLIYFFLSKIPIRFFLRKT
jgi:hypothetical protein